MLKMVFSILCLGVVSSPIAYAGSVCTGESTRGKCYTCCNQNKKVGAQGEMEPDTQRISACQKTCNKKFPALSVARPSDSPQKG